MNTPANMQREIERKTGKSFLDLIRTRYWASFTTIEALVCALGCTEEQLKFLMSHYAWELQGPPALKFQNGPISDAPVLRSDTPHAVTVKEFVVDSAGALPSVSTQATVEADERQLRVCFTCSEPAPALLRKEAGTREAERNPFNVGVWECHLGRHEGSYQWMTQKVREQGTANLLQQGRSVPPRPYSVLEDDCVIVFLTPINVGEDKSYLDVTRFEENPFELARQLPSSVESRIYQTGTFYYIAVNPAGVILDAYYDPWENGFFWPSWDSESQARVTRGAESWSVKLTVPFHHLEPLMDPGAVWGIDLYRWRPARGTASAEYSQARKTVFFRYEGKSIATRVWRPTFEDIDGEFNRHAWVPAQMPHVLEMTHRGLPEAEARRLDREIPYGGWPDPGDWRKADVISRFFEDRTGAPARARTQVQLLQDSTHLFVKFECEERHTDQLQVISAEDEKQLYGDSSVANFLDRREHFGIGWGDFVEIILAPGFEESDRYHAGYYDILVNTKSDLLERYYDPFGMWSLQEAEQWHSGTLVRTLTHDGGWGAQVAIPFQSIYGIRKAGAVWHMNLLRKRTAKGDDPWRELSAWSPTYSRPRDVGRFGTLKLAGARFASMSQGTDTPRVYLGRRADEPVRATVRRRDRDCLRDVCFADATHGWAVGGMGTILQTGNGGATWQEQESGAGYILETVCFTDRLRGWTVGGWPRQPGVAIAGGMGIILATSDGGKSWDVQWEGKGAWLYDVCFVNEKSGWAVGEYGTILKTSDGGQTWHHLRNSGTSNCLHSVHFVDEANGWAVGERETILVTSDGGRKWRRQYPPRLHRPFWAWEDFRAVHFADARCGCVVGGHCTILRTEDGGDTWHLVDPDLHANVREIVDLNDVWLSDGQNGWIVGEIGSVVMRTADGGRSWERIPTGFAGALHGAHFADSQTGWAVGERGARLTTADGGKTWVRRNSGPARRCWMYITPHLHHLNNLAGLVASMADDCDFACVFPTRTTKPCCVFADSSERDALPACWSVGARAVRVWKDFRGGRRRAPGRLHHHYQTKRGLEPLVRRLVAAIRALQPQVVIAEWPIMDEGYWAGEPAFAARAATLAFCCAGDPKKFPEQEELELRPWQPAKLYYTSHWFDDLYQVHPTTHTLSVKEGYSETLGMDYGEAAFRCRCCWSGLLDRGRFRMPPPGKRRVSLAPVTLHLKYDTSKCGGRPQSLLLTE